MSDDDLRDKACEQKTHKYSKQVDISLTSHKRVLACVQQFLLSSHEKTQQQSLALQALENYCQTEILDFELHNAVLALTTQTSDASDVQPIQHLLASGASIYSSTGRLAFKHAVMHGSFSLFCLFAQVLENEAPTHILADTIFYIAAQSEIDSGRRIQYLLSGNRPPPPSGVRCYTQALYNAVEAGHVEAARLLIDAGADAHSGSFDRHETEPRETDYLLILATIHGHAEMVGLLIHHGVTRTAPQAMECAAMQKFDDIVTLLMPFEYARDALRRVLFLEGLRHGSAAHAMRLLHLEGSLWASRKQLYDTILQRNDTEVFEYCLEKYGDAIPDVVTEDRMDSIAKGDNVALFSLLCRAFVGVQGVAHGLACSIGEGDIALFRVYLDMFPEFVFTDDLFLYMRHGIINRGRIDMLQVLWTRQGQALTRKHFWTALRYAICSQKFEFAKWIWLSPFCLQVLGPEEHEALTCGREFVQEIEDLLFELCAIGVSSDLGAGVDTGVDGRTDVEQILEYFFFGRPVCLLPPEHVLDCLGRCGWTPYVKQLLSTGVCFLRDSQLICAVMNDLDEYISADLCSEAPRDCSVFKKPLRKNHRLNIDDYGYGFLYRDVKNQNFGGHTKSRPFVASLCPRKRVHLFQLFEYAENKGNSTVYKSLYRNCQKAGIWKEIASDILNLHLSHQDRPSLAVTDEKRMKFHRHLTSIHYNEIKEQKFEFRYLDWLLGWEYDVFFKEALRFWEEERKTWPPVFPGLLPLSAPARSWLRALCSFDGKNRLCLQIADTRLTTVLSKIWDYRKPLDYFFLLREWIEKEILVVCKTQGAWILHQLEPSQSLELLETTLQKCIFTGIPNISTSDACLVLANLVDRIPNLAPCILEDMLRLAVENGRRKSTVSLLQLDCFHYLKQEQHVGKLISLFEGVVQQDQTHILHLLLNEYENALEFQIPETRDLLNFLEAVFLSSFQHSKTCGCLQLVIDKINTRLGWFDKKRVGRRLRNVTVDILVDTECFYFVLSSIFSVILKFFADSVESLLPVGNDELPELDISGAVSDFWTEIVKRDALLLRQVLDLGIGICLPTAHGPAAVAWCLQQDMIVNRREENLRVFLARETDERFLKYWIPVLGCCEAETANLALFRFFMVLEEECQRRALPGPGVFAGTETMDVLLRKTSSSFLLGKIVLRHVPSQDDLERLVKRCCMEDLLVEYSNMEHAVLGRVLNVLEGEQQQTTPLPLHVIQNITVRECDLDLVKATSLKCSAVVAVENEDGNRE